MVIKFYRYENESDEELIYRIASHKDEIGSWQAVADILNELTDNEYTESKYRKQYQTFCRMLNANQKKFGDNETVLETIRDERQELEKQRIKMRDERNELNRKIREQARRESFVALVESAIAKTEHHPLQYNYHPPLPSDNDLLVHLTDIHAGIHIDNFWNVYNMDELQKRFEYYIAKIIEIKNRHSSENCYVVIGEIISGLIHNNLRIENNEDVIQQFIKVSNCISDFLAILSNTFDHVYVYITPGNHSRLSPNKDESLAGENMDILLPHFLRGKLQNYINIHIEDNKIERNIAIFGIRGNNIFAVHGDKDSVTNVVQNFTMMFRIIPDIVLMGHRHRNGLTTVFNTKVIESGCVSGADNYAIDKRLKTAPEQTVAVINENGLECIYDIQLSR